MLKNKGISVEDKAFPTVFAFYWDSPMPALFFSEELSMEVLHIQLRELMCTGSLLLKWWIRLWLIE